MLLLLIIKKNVYNTSICFIIETNLITLQKFIQTIIFIIFYQLRYRKKDKTNDFSTKLS